MDISDASVVRAKEVLKMSTINGAKALGFDCGEVKVGKKADLILIDTQKPHMQPNDNLLSHLVYSAKSSDVYLTMVNGEILYRDGKFLREDVDTIYKKVNEIKERLKNEYK